MKSCLKNLKTGDEIHSYGYVYIFEKFKYKIIHENMVDGLFYCFGRQNIDIITDSHLLGFSENIRIKKIKPYK